MKALCLLVFCASLLLADGAKILGLFYFPSRSHHILGSSLLKALAARGHQVTMVSPFPSKERHDNYEDLDLPEISEHANGTLLSTFMIAAQKSSILARSMIIDEELNRINHILVTSSAVQGLLKSNRKFDIIIQVWAANEGLLGLAHHLGASTIAFSTMGSSFMTNELTRNPEPPSYLSSLIFGYPNEMKFCQRMANTLSNIVMKAVYLFYMRPRQESFRQMYFPKAPTVDEMASNVSLVLLNSHFSIESPRPYVPNMIQIGGFHVQEPKPLKGELKEFTDSATNGFIYFSLGSNFKSSDLTPTQLQGVLKTFEKLPLKILWKFENDDLPDLPKNVKIKKWLPQSDILGHPNLKLFITHGGLLSTTEAIYRSVPMVNIPIFGDQEVNTDDSVRKGFAVKVDYQTLSEETLTTAINEILKNSSYKEKIAETSALLRDQPVKPLDKAIYWVEYVFRHKGAHHLKISGLKLTWYQFYLLDVVVVMGLTPVVLFGFTFIVFKAIKRIVCTKGIAERSKTKKE